MSWNLFAQVFDMFTVVKSLIISVRTTLWHFYGGSTFGIFALFKSLVISQWFSLEHFCCLFALKSWIFVACDQVFDMFTAAAVKVKSLIFSVRTTLYLALLQLI